MPKIVARLAANGQLPATNQLHLAIGLPLRDSAGLDKFLAELYDPRSPNFRKFLTPEAFTARFGPTEQDYLAVKKFAIANGFIIKATHSNRLLLDVATPVAAAERAFHVKLRTYRHPAGARNFYAPDSEPMVPAALPVMDVQGLSDYSQPQPRLWPVKPGAALPKNGSAPDGYSYFGDDFRNAYVPGSALTGAGQQVGLLQFDGFYSNDIAAYAAAAGGGRTNIVIQTVLLDGYNGAPGVNGGNAEVSLDIEMAMAMAPGLSKIVVFEANSASYVNDILAAMVTNTAIKQFSCSWGWSGGVDATTENHFKEMAAQGQSFFSASGDSDAFLSGQVDDPSQTTYPSGSPNITQVGGVTLTMSGSGVSYVSETVWNRGGGVGSSGGISSNAIPVWQQGISMTANGGAANRRNIPDVALTAEYCYVKYGNGSANSFGGTSCAAPLWAGFMALVNQQSAATGQPSVGFINPRVYEIARESIYNLAFHDAITGDNTWSSSPNQFYAAPGYDLCTGLGTPNGTNLIKALVVPDSLVLFTNTGFAATGSYGGPFAPAGRNFAFTNTGAAALDWSIINTSAWLSVSSSAGTLAPGASATVTVSVSASASSLPAGNYAATLWFSNANTQVAHGRLFTLQITDPLRLLTTNGFAANGPAGGPFYPDSQAVVFTNVGTGATAWSLINTAAWLSASSEGGLLAGNSSAAVTVFLNANADNLNNGVYTADLVLSNQTSAAAQNITFTASVGRSLVQNGGFETGDFTGWTLSGNGVDYQYIYNAVVSAADFPEAVHSGNFGTFLGDTQIAWLSQSVATMPGQTYLLSFWLDNPASGSSQQFLVNWNTNAAANQIYYLNNPPTLAWTNRTFFVTATGTNTTLRFGAKNPPNFFGLDDISLVPIPIPSFVALARNTNGLVFTWRTLAGVSYLVQYKTNLNQAGWINLITNTAVSETMMITNAINAEPERFYRIRRLP